MLILSLLLGISTAFATDPCAELTWNEETPAPTLAEVFTQTIDRTATPVVTLTGPDGKATNVPETNDIALTPPDWEKAQATYSLEVQDAEGMSKTTECTVQLNRKPTLQVVARRDLAVRDWNAAPSPIRSAAANDPDNEDITVKVEVINGMLDTSEFHGGRSAEQESWTYRIEELTSLQLEAKTTGSVALLLTPIDERMLEGDPVLVRAVVRDVSTPSTHDKKGKPGEPWEGGKCIQTTLTRSQRGTTTLRTRAELDRMELIGKQERADTVAIQVLYKQTPKGNCSEDLGLDGTSILQVQITNSASDPDWDPPALCTNSETKRCATGVGDDLVVVMNFAEAWAKLREDEELASEDKTYRLYVHSRIVTGKDHSGQVESPAIPVSLIKKEPIDSQMVTNPGGLLLTSQRCSHVTGSFIEDGVDLSEVDASTRRCYEQPWSHTWTTNLAMAPVGLFLTVPPFPRYPEFRLSASLAIAGLQTDGLSIDTASIRDTPNINLVTVMLAPDVRIQGLKAHLLPGVFLAARFDDGNLRLRPGLGVSVAIDLDLTKQEDPPEEPEAEESDSGVADQTAPLNTDIMTPTTSGPGDL